MTTAAEKFMKHPWERYAVPDTEISADFPGEPLIDEDTEEEAESVTLYLHQSYSGVEVSFDLTVGLDQTFDAPSSEALAQRLEEQLRGNKDVRVLSVKPRPLGDTCGAVQHVQIKSTGDFLLQWIIAAEEYTVFSGVTVPDPQLLPVAERFLSSISLSDETQDASAE